MRKFILVLMLSLLLASLGCASHSSRHANPERVLACGLFPCSNNVEYRDMDLSYKIVRTGEDSYVITGTAMPRNVSPDTQVELAIISFELSRDSSVFDSYSLPMLGNDLRRPLRFRHEFTTASEFNGIMFTWDIRYRR